MPDDDYWTRVATLRRRIADLLETLAPEDWDRPSLCEGWRVRDVAGHLSLVPVITSGQLLVAGPRARFDLNRINTQLARKHGSAPPAEIVARIREHADRRRTARMLDTRNSLFDLVVHSQDIAVPLDRRFSVDPEDCRLGLERVWEMGFPFHARRRLAGFALRATDADWSAGSGQEVQGDALALLMVLTGRAGTVSDRLDGPGAVRLVS